MTFLRSTSLLLLLAISACKTVRHEYVAPEDPEGRQCVAHCASIREGCRANEDQRALAEQSLCEQNVEADYYACMDHARNNKQQYRCNEERRTCSEYSDYDPPDYYRCSDEYNQCYADCGGEVYEITEE